MKTRFNFLTLVAEVFLFLCILFIPFPFYFFSFQQQITDTIFGNLIAWAGNSFFWVTLKSSQVYSDSASMYLLIFILFGFSFVASAILRFVLKKDVAKRRLQLYVYTLCLYYLCVILMKYGLDKVFKNQFYIPEPNTLYTPLGKLDKDILFWSSMGSSKLYNWVTGAIEILAAVFLFFRTTRLAGLLVSFVILLQVIVVNFAFDISVKLFSVFLFCITIYLFWPYGKRVGAAIFSNKVVNPAIYASGFVFVSNIFGKTFLKCLLAGFILLESFYPYLHSRNFNDDKALRPFLHGAYAVQAVLLNNDTLVKGEFPYKRFFIHRNGYLILQMTDDSMQDYRLTYDTSNQLLFLEDYLQNRLAVNYQLNENDSLLVLDYLLNEKPVIITGKAENWKELPLLHDQFHWIVE